MSKFTKGLLFVLVLLFSCENNNTGNKRLDSGDIDYGGTVSTTVSGTVRKPKVGNICVPWETNFLHTEGSNNYVINEDNRNTIYENRSIKISNQTIHTLSLISEFDDQIHTISAGASYTLSESILLELESSIISIELDLFNQQHIVKDIDNNGSTMGGPSNIYLPVLKFEPSNTYYWEVKDSNGAKLTKSMGYNFQWYRIDYNTNNLYPISTEDHYKVTLVYAPWNRDADIQTFGIAAKVIKPNSEVYTITKEITMSAF